MALESNVVFEGRMLSLGLSEFRNTFNQLGWVNHATFACASSFVPGTGGSDEQFQIDIVDKVLDSRNDPKKAILRLLHFESFSMLAVEMQRKASRTDESDKPRLLPALERKARFTKIAQRLKGLKLFGELNPSNAIVDKFVTMLDSGELRFLPWEEVTRRDKEVKGVKKDDSWKIDPVTKNFKQCSEASEDPADLSSELRLKGMLQRRGVAMEIAGLLTFEIHDEMIDVIFRELDRQPSRGRARTSLSQVLEFDEEVFSSVAQMALGEMVPTGDGTLVLDKFWKEVVEDQRVKSLLNQLETRAAPQKRDRDPEFDKMKEELKRLRSSMGKGSGNGKGHGGGKGSGGGKGGGKAGAPPRRKDTPLPKELLGCSAGDGKVRYCFAYNLAGCKRPTKNDACEYGLHACMKKGCGEVGHSQKNCTKR